MRFATRRLVLIALVDKFSATAFKPIFTLKEPFSRIVVKSELVLSFLSIKNF